MKICPQCNAQYDDSMFFCLEDGMTLRSLQDSSPSNPATSEKTLVLPNQEKTISLPTEEKVSDLPKTEEKTLNLPNSAENTLAFPGEPATVQESVQTKAWEPATLPPTPNPVSNTNENFTKTPLVNNWNNQPIENANGSSGIGKYLVLGGVLGGLALIVSALGGWWLLRPATNDIAVGNINKQIENSNGQFSSNLNTSGSYNNSNTNSSNTNLNIVPASNTNQLTNNQLTPKPSPTKDKSPTPTPKESPSSAPTETPLPKTPTPIPKTPTPPSVPSTVSGGVLNGKAVNLVKPPYPPAAKAVRASGAVNVQVMIDENGNVVSATAVSGHALLRAASEAAARASKFSPTLLGGQKVKVTGVIVYNFVAQ